MLLGILELNNIKDKVLQQIEMLYLHNSKENQQFANY